MTGERNADARIGEFIFIAEIATIHSRPVIYSGERSSAPRPARARKKDLEEQRDRIPLDIKDKYLKLTTDQVNN